jgi:hypothetical protein
MLLVTAVAALGVGLSLRDFTRPNSASHTPVPRVWNGPLPSPCALLSNAVVSRVFEAKVGYSSLDPSDDQCTWSGLPFVRQYGQKKLMISLAHATRTEFDQSASYSLIPGTTDGSLVRLPSQPLSDLGESAYWFSNFQELAAYHGDTVIYVSGVLLTKPLATEEAVARTIMRRLDKLSAHHPPT